MMKFVKLLLIFAAEIQLNLACTETTISGSHAPKTFCSGDLIFEDNFDTFDPLKWKHDNTMWGGGNDEFEWYVNDRKNTFTKDGKLHIKPTYTSTIFGEDFIYEGRVVIPPEECTISWNDGCDRKGEGADGDKIVNPIRSGKVTTTNSFAFKYGTLEIRAKMPAGDWIWPALWMMPRYDVYGGWPRSGEIDLMETRGNRQLFSGETSVGIDSAGHTMHFGPSEGENGYPTTHKTINKDFGFNEDFHNYKLKWTPTDIEFFIDDESIYKVEAGEGFWKRGGFSGENIWAGRSVMAPFDQEFFIIMNNAVGGNYFADSFQNRAYAKPWVNYSPTTARDFWAARAQWEPTWNLHNDDSHLQIDYVKVWAL